MSLTAEQVKTLALTDAQALVLRLAASPLIMELPVEEFVPDGQSAHKALVEYGLVAMDHNTDFVATMAGHLWLALHPHA